jgi:hypothetical protein
MTDTGVLHLWRTTVNPPCRDPLARLMDPAFNDVLWFYEKSRTEPDIPGKLHAKQLEQLHADRMYRHRWLFWGNQVGKTAFGAIDLALLCLGRHPVQKVGAAGKVLGLSSHVGSLGKDSSARAAHLAAAGPRD